MPTREPADPLWTRSYDHWSAAMGDAARRHRVTVAYGSETHDAWRAGVSPDEYAQRLATAQAPRRAPEYHPPRDERTPVDIAWYIVPNGNQRAGGYMPVYRVDGGREQGDTYGRGYDPDTARRLAHEMAQEEAQRYSGDWRITVRPAETGPEERGPAPRGARRMEQEVAAVLREETFEPLVGFESVPSRDETHDVSYRWSPSGKALVRRTRTPSGKIEYHAWWSRWGSHRDHQAMKDWTPLHGHPSVDLTWEPLTYQQARHLVA